MDNDYTRVCNDVSDVICQASGMANAVPTVQHAFMAIACNLKVLAGEERKRMFWEMVEGNSPKSRMFAEIHNNRQDQYATPLFSKQCTRNQITDKLCLVIGWYLYLQFNKKYISGELLENVKAEGVYSHGGGITRFTRESIFLGETDLIRTYIDILYPGVVPVKVFYTNVFEGYERVDINSILSCNPSNYIDYNKLEEELSKYSDFYHGGAFEDLENDVPTTPDWAALTTKGQHLENGEVVVTISNFTVNPQTKTPRDFVLHFYRDDEDNLCYMANTTAVSFLGESQGYWKYLPFLIRRLIGKLGIDRSGSWKTDYEMSVNDILPIDVVAPSEESQLQVET